MKWLFTRFWADRHVRKKSWASVRVPSLCGSDWLCFTECWHSQVRWRGISSLSSSGASWDCRSRWWSTGPWIRACTSHITVEMCMDPGSGTEPRKFLRSDPGSERIQIRPDPGSVFTLILLSKVEQLRLRWRQEQLLERKKGSCFFLLLWMWSFKNCPNILQVELVCLIFILFSSQIRSGIRNRNRKKLDPIRDQRSERKSWIRTSLIRIRMSLEYAPLRRR